jgi:hypothetical protein
MRSIVSLGLKALFAILGVRFGRISVRAGYEVLLGDVELLEPKTVEPAFGVLERRSRRFELLSLLPLGGLRFCGLRLLRLIVEYYKVF